MAPITTDKFQPSQKTPQVSGTYPAYMAGYLQQSQFHGLGHIHTNINYNTNHIYSALPHGQRPYSNVTHTFTPHNHALPLSLKENVVTTPTKVCIEHSSGTGKKGLEILDFHESWLEELELYKDRTNMHKVYNHANIFSGMHNDAHGHRRRISHAHGHQNKHQHHSCNQTQSPIVQNKNQNNFMALVNAANLYSGTAHTENNATKMNNYAKATNGNPNPKVMMRNMVSVDMDNAVPQITNAAFRLGGGEILNKSSPGMESIRHMEGQKQSQQPSISVKQQQQVIKQQLQLPLKRNAQNEMSPTNKTKRHAANNTHANTNHILTQNSRAQGGQTSSNLKAIQKQISPNKIIVNQFHASHLLNSHHNEEQSKILAQNGLTKSAANAYATTLYASAVKQGSIASHGTSKITRTFFPADRSNYVGVSLASDRYRPCSPPNSDDPCTAIDEVNDFSDSTDDEEYLGEPFYLPGESEKETQQSMFIRFQPETSSESNEEDEEPPMYYKPKSILTPSLFPNVPPYLNFSCHIYKGPSMPAALHKVLKWKLSPVMPKIVKRVVLNSGFRIIKNTTDWMAVWEKHMKSPGFRTIRSHQKYNHMPGSFRIGRKDTMWRSIHNNMRKFGTKEFGFMQRSYIMPDDLEHLRQVWPKNATRLTKWIVKPPASARGTGIRIVNKWSQFPKDRPLVVQKYIERPLLINDNKFDMRIYVVVTSINPLRIYMYKDGLARFASVKYSPELNHLDEKCMHLTNYSINKFSENYTKNEDFNLCQGHKWTLQSLWSCLEGRGVNTKRLWATLRNLVIKAIISGESGLNRMYRQNVNFRYNCFELFGFDILLDENLIPWLLEINISPSLHSELPLDLHVKGPLIQAVLNTALYQIPPKLSEKSQKEISDEMNLTGPLCHDKRLFTTCLTAEEVRKHNQFTHRSIEYREEYLDGILEHLLPDDIRCLIITEDEYARCKPLERVFPTIDSHKYLKFIDNPRYYNRLLDAWEHRYGNNRIKGITLLRRLCEDQNHLEVAEAAMEKEPNVTLTDIDMLHTRKSDDPSLINISALAAAVNEVSRANENKIGSINSQKSKTSPAKEQKIGGTKIQGNVDKNSALKN